MKTLEVRDQYRLSFGKCVELVLSGIRFRLFRAAITVTIIALAVAFLMSMLTESLTARRVALELGTRTAPQRLLVFWVGRLSAELTDRQLSEQLSFARPGDDRWREFGQWGSLDEARLAKLSALASDELQYLAFFRDELSEGERRPLVGRNQGTTIFSILQQPAAFEEFEKQFRLLAKQMHADLSAFQGFLADWNDAQADRRAIHDGHAKALAALKPIMAGRDAKALLAGADASLPEKLAASGFRMTDEQLQTPRREATLSLDAERLAALLKMVGLADRWFHKPIEMSGGQQQRTAIARSMANNPAVLLCDEPTGNLDLHTGGEVHKILKQLNSERGVTIICATHDHRLIDMADRIMWIRDGKIERLADRSDVTVETGTIGGQANA